jgi:hypothetical protein
MSEDNSDSIRETELGTNVLSLTEVLQTFDVESSMFHIKTSSEKVIRAVILKKK